MPPSAPSVGRPAQGFGTLRAQRWVMASAIVIAMTYALRRTVEPAMSTAPARGTPAARLAGLGSPPPSLQRWTVAYGTGFMMLALIALPAPELAASLAMLVLVGSLLTNGTAIVADIGGLEGVPAASATAVQHEPTFKPTGAAAYPVKAAPGAGQ